MEHLTDKELLNFAVENGMIDFNTIQKQIEMNERKKYLEMHTYKIWRSPDGKWYTYFPDKEKGRIKRKRNTEEEINKLIIDYWKKEEENPTISEVFNEWNDRRLSLNKISAATHIRNRQCFDRHYKEFGKKRIKFIESEDVIDFLEEQIPEYNLSAKAFSNIKGITKGFFKRAKKRKLIDWSIEEAYYDLDVTDCDFKKTIKEDYEEVFDEIEMQKVMQYLIDNRDVKNLGIILMFVTGMRVGELSALRNDMFGECFVKVRRTETRYKVDDKWVYDVKEYPKSEAGVREIVIPKDYLWIIKEIKTLNPFGEYCFINNKGERLTTNCFRRRLEKICKKLNVYRKSPHKVRKTYGTILLDNKVDKQLAENQMGHSDVYVTENHYHRNRKSINKKAEILSSIPDFTLSQRLS